MTDLGTGWTESRALMGRSQEAVRQALEEIESVLPFRLRGIDSDNGSEFINWHLKAYCEGKRIQFTRGRPGSCLKALTSTFPSGPMMYHPAVNDFW